MQYPVPTTILINGALTAVGGTWPAFDLRTLSGDAGQILSAGGDGGAFLQLNPAANNLASYAPATGLYVAPHSIGALTDVDITTTAPVAGDVLTWDAVGGEFIPTAATVYGRADTDTVALALSAGNVFTADVRLDVAANWLTSSAAGLRVAPKATADLTDINAAAAGAGDLLIHDGTEYVPGTLSSVDLDDFSNTAATAGQVPVWTAGEWLPATLGLANLSDVDLTGAVNGSVLRYDGTDWSVSVDDTDISVITPNLALGRWTHSDGAATPTTVNIFSTSVDADQMLSIGANGGSHLSPFSIGVLSDVDLTTAPANGDLLGYDGTDWIAVTPAAAGANFLTGDLTATANRTHDFGGFTHTWNDIGALTALGDGQIQFASVDGTDQALLVVDHAAQAALAFGDAGSSSSVVLDGARAQLIYAEGPLPTSIDLDTDGIDVVIPATSDLKVNGAAGTDGQRLTSTGPGTPPIWDDVAPRLLQHNWGYADFCDTPSGIAPVLNMIAGDLVELGIVASSAPDADEDWEVLLNGAQVATITLGAGATSANVLLGAAVAVGGGDILTVNPTSATPGTPSTYGSISALLEVA